MIYGSGRRTAIGARPDRAGSPLLGATLHLSTAAPIVTAPVRANGLGAVEVPLPLPLSSQGVSVFAQFLFPNGAGCAPTALGASHGLELTIQ